jgi:hypothetical protein
MRLKIKTQVPLGSAFNPGPKKKHSVKNFIEICHDANFTSLNNKI